MRIVDVNFIFDENLATHEEQLKQHYTVVGWAEALQRKGVEVIAIKRFKSDRKLQLNGVLYYFIKDGFPGHPKAWQFPLRLLKTVSSLEPDIVHLHGLFFSMQTFLLRLFLKKKTVIVIQHHGGPIPKGIRKSIHDLFNSVANAFFFTTIEQGKQWFEPKKTTVKILPVMEGATFFDYDNRLQNRDGCHQDKEIYRDKTGMKGSPVFLWVGRLDKNKDPLTVLSAFQILFNSCKNARLYMVYSGEQLLVDVKKKISDSDVLKDRVKLLGKIPHEEMDAYYCSADYFVLGSHYEGSGYALSEALRCGCIPIVTDIPSFRMMTNGGQLGALWEAGYPNSFVEAVNFVLCKSLDDERKACIDFFDKNLSFDAIAETTLAHYNNLLVSVRKSN